MTDRPKRKLTTYEKVMKYMGLSFLALFVIFLIWLFGFKISFLKVDDSNPERYSFKYRGHMYYKDDDFYWNLRYSEFMGFANGLSDWAYKSFDENKNEFIVIWNSFSVRTSGYGTFYRKDIEIGLPTSDNIESIKIFSNRTSSEIEQEILDAFDSYANGEVDYISYEEAKENYEPKEICYFTIEHNEYPLYAEALLKYFNNNYYIMVIGPTTNYIPISYEAGEKFDKSINSN